jgi:hypothetical protein
MIKYLFRGVNAELHVRNSGRLLPKALGQIFKRSVYYNEDVYYGDGSVYGDSETNALMMHQRNSSKYITSGVSTTPHIEIARGYATYEGASGFIYKIDVSLLSGKGVTTYIVCDHVAQPTKPQDEEVILVAKDYGPLPAEIVVDITNA